MVNLVTSERVQVRQFDAMINTATTDTRKNVVAMIHAIRSCHNLRLVVTALAFDVAPSAIHSSSALRSDAFCHRRSGSLAKQRRSTRSKAGGATPASDGGSRSKIAAMTLAGDKPSNARLPVSISYST